MSVSCQIKKPTTLWIPFSLYAVKMETRSKGRSVADVLRKINLSAQNFTVHQEKTLRACRVAGLLLWVVISMRAMVVEIFPSVTTRVVIGIVRNVKVIKEKNGS